MCTVIGTVLGSMQLAGFYKSRHVTYKGVLSEESMDDAEVAKAVRILRCLCWAWAVTHVVGVFLSAWHAERELRSEAKLLMDKVCTKLYRGYGAGSALLRCDDARAVLGAGPMLLVVFERAGVNLVTGTLAAARREIGAFLRVVGLLGAMTTAVLLLAETASKSTRDWARQVYEQRAESAMRKSAGESLIYMGDGVKED